MSITKTIRLGGEYYREGDTITYDYIVENVGVETFDAIAVSDDKLGTVSCPFSTLAPGASMTCTPRSHVATATDVSAGSITNVATVTGTGRTTGNTITSEVTATAYRYSGCCRLPGVCSEVAGPAACADGTYLGDGIACPPGPCRKYTINYANYAFNN